MNQFLPSLLNLVSQTNSAQYCKAGPFRTDNCHLQKSNQKYNKTTSGLCLYIEFFFETFPKR